MIKLQKIVTLSDIILKTLQLNIKIQKISKMKSTRVVSWIYKINKYKGITMTVYS